MYCALVYAIVWKSVEVILSISSYGYFLLWGYPKPQKRPMLDFQKMFFLWFSLFLQSNIMYKHKSYYTNNDTWSFGKCGEKWKLSGNHKNQWFSTHDLFTKKVFKVHWITKSLSLFALWADTLLHLFQLIMNAVACLITNIPKHCHITPVL